MKCKCGKKLNRVSRWYTKWFTKNVVYVIAVVSEDGERIIEKYPVCTRCGLLYAYLADMHKKYGLKAMMEISDEHK